MGRKIYSLKVGNGVIRDILHPTPDQLDLHGMRLRLRHIRRFSNNPAALTIDQHESLVVMIAKVLGHHPSEWDEDVLFWCRHHDNHEAIIGDIPGPLKSLIGENTDVLKVVETRLDIALCEKLGREYPSPLVREIVHGYDKIAETVEWLYVLGERKEPWNVDLDPILSPEKCRDLIAKALVS